MALAIKLLLNVDALVVVLSLEATAMDPDSLSPHAKMQLRV